jgi:hypothetical protein
MMLMNLFKNRIQITTKSSKCLDFGVTKVGIRNYHLESTDRFVNELFRDASVN